MDTVHRTTQNDCESTTNQTESDQTYMKFLMNKEYNKSKSIIIIIIILLTILRHISIIHIIIDNIYILYITINIIITIGMMKFVSGSQFRNTTNNSKLTISPCENCMVNNKLQLKNKEVIRGLKLTIQVCTVVIYTI